MSLAPNERRLLIVLARAVEAMLVRQYPRTMAEQTVLTELSAAVKDLAQNPGVGSRR